MGDYIHGDLVRHEKFGIGRVEETSGIGEQQKCFVYFPRTDKTAYVAKEHLVLLTSAESDAYELVKLAVAEIRSEELPVVAMAERWRGGELILKPNQEDRESKAIPLEVFFHKLVMIRDRIRVMEQQINGHKVLSEEEKIRLQQYITRIYGSLTTFNILFADKKDHFVGQKGDE